MGHIQLFQTYSSYHQNLSQIRTYKEVYQLAMFVSIENDGIFDKC